MTAPALAKAYPTLAALFDETALTPVARQTVPLTVSVANGCDYCVAAHTVIASMQKVPDPVMRAARTGAPIPDPKLEALRRVTAEVVRTRGRPSGGEPDAFVSAGYSRAQVLAVLLGVGLKTLSNHTNHIAATPLDPAFQKALWSAVA
jgi:AhpD family alkylhydroperoxidase